MKEQVLSIPQMQELIDVGIDVSKASMYWYIKANPITKGWDEPEICIEKPLWPNPPNKVIPTFTLQDIIDILPGSIEEDIIGRFDYELRIKKDGVAYESFDALDSKSEPFVFDEYYIDGEQCKTVLDCAFEMLKSLKNLKKYENKKIQKSQ